MVMGMNPCCIYLIWLLHIPSNADVFVTYCWYIYFLAEFLFLHIVVTPYSDIAGTTDEDVHITEM